MYFLYTFNNNKRVDDFTIYAIDFEGSIQTGVLEYGVVGLSAQHGIFSTETNLCKNKTKIPPSETQCHHLSENALKEQLDFSCYIDRFIDLRSKAFFCAHNASYENALLNNYCPIVTNSHTLPKMKTQQWGPWIDTYFLYKKFIKNNCYALNELINFFQLNDVLEQLGRKFCPPQRKNFHCALFDTLACALLLLNFIRNIRSNQVNITWLLEQSAPVDISREIRQPQLWD